MKKNVFTKSIRFLIVALLILAVALPKKLSQKVMLIVLIMWLCFTLGYFLWHRRNKWTGKISSILYTIRQQHSQQPCSNDSVSETETVPKPCTGTYPSVNTFTEAETDALLLHLSLRITEKLKSAYPNATWQWKEKPSLHELLAGATVRIAVENMEQYTHSDITFDRFGRLHVEPMRIGNFSPMEGTADVSEEDAKPDPAVVDVRAWYELIGQHILESQITELNANGHSKLTIKENGDIVINRQKKEVFVTALEAFPGKNYWNELVTILEANELAAKIAGNTLQVSWI